MSNTAEYLDDRGRGMYGRGRVFYDRDMDWDKSERQRQKRDQSLDSYLRGNPARNQQSRLNDAIGNASTGPFGHLNGDSVNRFSENQVGKRNCSDIDQSRNCDDILFDKRSGVTRITAQRQRRHSVQFGGTGVTTPFGSVSSGERNHDITRDFFADRFKDKTNQSESKKVAQPRPTFTPQDTIPDGYASDTEILYQHLDNRNRYNMGVVSMDKPRRPSADLGTGDPNVRHGTAIFIRRPSISSLTLEKDSYVRDADGRAFRKGHQSDIESDKQLDGSMSDTGGGDRYVKRNIHVRRHSISTPSLKHAPAPKILRDFQKWDGIKTPTAQPSTDRIPHQQKALPVRSTTSNYADSDSDTSCGTLVPVRRYSVTYAPTVNSDDLVGPKDPVNAKTYLAPPEQSTSSHKKTRRRRCRPLSIVREDISPISTPDDDPDSMLLNGGSSNQIVSRKPRDIVPTMTSSQPSQNLGIHQGGSNNNTEVSIQGDKRNVNVMASGNVQISLNGSQPMSMIGRNKDGSGQFAAWTSGTSIPRPSDYNHAGYPLGMWRQGNVLVDSVSPTGSCMSNVGPGLFPGHPWGQAQPYPVIPMMLVPCQPIDPSLYSVTPNIHPQLQNIANASLYTPLSVDTGNPGQVAGALPVAMAGQVGVQQGTSGLLGTSGQPNSHSGPQIRNVGPMASSHVAVSNAGQVGVGTSTFGSSDVRKLNPTPTVNNNAPNGHHHGDVQQVVQKKNDQNCDTVIGQQGKLPDCVQNGCQSENSDPEERRDIKDIIANFESKKQDSVDEVLPQFGASFESSKTVASNGESVTSGEIYCQTEPTIDTEEENFKLNVEKRDGWVTTDEQPPKEPTELHAYIAEMSISEVRYSDEENKKD